MFQRTLRALVVACLAASPAAFAQTEIKLGHVGEPGSIFQKSADEYAKKANAKLGNKAKVVVTIAIVVSARRARSADAIARNDVFARNRSAPRRS